MFSRASRVVFLSVSALLFTTYILLPSHASILGSGGHQQFVLTDKSPVKRVAIIGAGAAGSSAAYFLSEYARKAEFAINATIYERCDYIGGRTTTVNAYDDPEEPVELGGSIFVQINKNLYDAAKHFNLPIADYGGGSPDGADQLGVWDGQQFVMTLHSGGWWETIKMLWKYGLSPMRTQSLVKKTVGQFLKMYDEPVFPWKSLTQTALDLELISATTSTGLQFLKSNNIYPPFTTELIQASTRVNYGSNLGHIHGLESMVAMSTDNAMAITGGNWKIFHKMIETSNAKILIETPVTSIERVPDKKAWTVKATKKNGDVLEDEYDEVIIAAPYQFTNITSKSIKAPETIKYNALHVTLFASPYRLSPKYFNFDKELVPDMILTTLPTSVEPDTANVGPAKFWSVNILRSVERELEKGVKRREYIYKIFSPDYWPDEKIYEMMDLPKDADILTWSYRKLWHAYPIEEPRATFQEAQLDFGLWYTAGMEAFISCMETMSLSGKNVAANIVEGWTSARRNAALLHPEGSL
ncbi:hypothetical protein H072_7066 [Dactylellina haptotyla CBS 200.50]|uniref:Prenylcysteine lyase domain-containing protein n=1 Tax=Dactylellina haptotyla (strain CBS 200.50) TaxID=1284197 RepID=S8BIJ1_DACHA|nr:hypothetical protein H072_7066 [Dactylellina haptotyla CBS 200.50]